MTDDHTASARSTRDAVIDRYSGFARTALAGGAPTDCDPDAFADGCFGAAAYPGADAAPQAALRASLGCGNPLAVGFTAITITTTHPAGPGLHSAIIQAAKPATQDA